MKNSIKQDANVAAGLSVEIDQLIESGLLPVGKFVTIETINPIYHGRLVAVTPSYYFLSEASWLGDMGQRADYARGHPPTEANYMGDMLPIERTACVLGPQLAPIQKALSGK